MFTTQTEAPKKSPRRFVNNKKEIRQNPMSNTNDTESFAKLVEAAELCRIQEESTVDAVKKLSFVNNNRTKQNLFDHVKTIYKNYRAQCLKNPLFDCFLALKITPSCIEYKSIPINNSKTTMYDGLGTDTKKFTYDDNNTGEHLLDDLKKIFEEYRNYCSTTAPAKYYLVVKIMPFGFECKQLPTKIIRRVPPPTNTSDPLHHHHMKFFQGVPPPTNTSHPLQTNHNSNSNSPALPSLASLQGEFYVNITTKQNVNNAKSTQYQQKTKINSRLAQDYQKMIPYKRDKTNDPVLISFLNNTLESRKSGKCAECGIFTDEILQIVRDDINYLILFQFIIGRQSQLLHQYQIKDDVLKIVRIQCPQLDSEPKKSKNIFSRLAHVFIAHFPSMVVNCLITLSLHQIAGILRDIYHSSPKTKKLLDKLWP